MAKPLSAPIPVRGGMNGSANGRPNAAALLHQATAGGPAQAAASEDVQEIEQLREENEQLRALCMELEQALHEATVHAAADGDARATEYEAILEEKTETIRQLHEQVQRLQAAADGSDEKSHDRRPPGGPAPREDELLTLSEDLERERRQLQEDEVSLMQQMRDMEVSMARERAEMARQRNDMQRLQSEVRHELERLERSGALQSKMDSLKSKLQDATTRRGAAPGLTAGQSPQPQAFTPTPAPAAAKKDSLFGRLFGNK